MVNLFEHNLLKSVNETIYDPKTDKPVPKAVANAIEANTVTLMDFPISARSSMYGNVRGKWVMGCVKISGKQHGLLNVDKYDVQWAREQGLKINPEEEVYCRLDNVLSKVRIGQTKDGEPIDSLEYANLAKVNLQKQSITMIDTETAQWKKAVRCGEIIIHMPFLGAIN